MGTEKWDVIADRIPTGEGRDLLRSVTQRANPHLTTGEIEAMLVAPMTVVSAVTAEAANALMRELEEKGIPARKRRVAKESILEPAEGIQRGFEPRYCARCGAALAHEARFCTKCLDEVPGLADSTAPPVPALQRKQSLRLKIAAIMIILILVGLLSLLLEPPTPPRIEPSTENQVDQSPLSETARPRSGMARVKGGLGCVTKASLSRAFDFMNANDEVAVRRLLKTGLCIALRAGTPVFVEEVSTSEGIVRIRAPGDLEGLWVPIEMVQF